ncbi:MAG TPA: penicillin-binding transpeptidase domain-containing protein [Rhodothermales bacterium]|nr:penicillin-binding transpeptidase domain-containing protein [Rhodothermales bacterium]
MFRFYCALCLLLTSLLSACTPVEEQPSDPPPASDTAFTEVDLDSFFVDIEGTFVMQDAQTGKTHIHNPERARTRFLPASTFKIPNSLIALETGVAIGSDFALPWDATAVPPQEWWPDAWRQPEQTLRSAFQNSVVWYYQELARRIGEERMAAYVTQFDYGNEDIGGGIDQFWLNGDLRISPIEQVAFLQHFYKGDLGVSDSTTAIVKDIMLLEETPAYRLSGKTGTAEITDTRALAWLVGFVERGEDVYFYALNIEGETVWEQWPPQQRADLVRQILQALAVLPA